jgi:hypothetical protein
MKKSGGGSFKMPHGSPKSDSSAPGYGDGRPSYVGHGNTMLNTPKNSQKAAKFAPGTPQTPNNVSGPGSKTSYPKRGLPSNGMPKSGVLSPPPKGMSPKQL